MAARLDANSADVKAVLMVVASAAVKVALLVAAKAVVLDVPKAVLRVAMKDELTVDLLVAYLVDAKVVMMAALWAVSWGFEMVETMALRSASKSAVVMAVSKAAMMVDARDENLAVA